jgi:hypothetical protein
MDLRDREAICERETRGQGEAVWSHIAVAVLDEVFSLASTGVRNYKKR